MRKKRFNKRIRTKTKWKIAAFIGVLLLITASLLYYIDSKKWISFNTFKNYTNLFEEENILEEDYNFFFNEIFTEQKKLQIYLALDFTNTHLRDQQMAAKETSNLPKSTEQQQLSNNESTIYITFDDGPTPYTKEIIDLLEAYDMKATFFMLEPAMRKHPDSLTYLIEKGHQPALHGVTHRLDKFYESKDSVVREMDLANQTLFELTGMVSNIIRTPYGSSPHMTEEYFDAVLESGYFLFDWTIDSLDWKYPSEQYVINTIQQLENKRDLANRPRVILLHDRASTLENLEKLLIYIKEKGYQTDIIDYRYYGYSF